MRKMIHWRPRGRSECHELGTLRRIPARIAYWPASCSGQRRSAASFTLWGVENAGHGWCAWHGGWRERFARLAW